VSDLGCIDLFRGNMIVAFLYEGAQQNETKTSSIVPAAVLMLFPLQNL